MNADLLAEFYRRCGRSTFRAAGAWWYMAHPFFVMSVPYHREISVSSLRQEEIFEGRHILGARFFGPPSGPGKASFLIVCYNKAYDLKSLSPKARNQTRQGLRCCEVRALGWPEVAAANDLQAETCARQNRMPDFTAKAWGRLCEAAGSLAGFEAWGAFSKGKLASFAIVFHCDEYASILYQYSRSDLLFERPNNALIYVMTKELLGAPGTEVVSYGPEPLEDLTNLNRFKFEMGYTKLLINQVAVLRPGWNWVARRGVSRFLTGASEKMHWGSSLRKASGVIDLVRSSRYPGESTPIETETFSIIPVQARDCGQLAKLHLAAFPGFFLSSIGASFLKTLYEAFLVDRSAICLLARKQDRIAGFVMGVCQPRGFVIRALLRRSPQLVSALFHSEIRGPSTVLRLMSAGLRPVFHERPRDEAVLFSIAVEPSLKNLGLGSELVRVFLDKARLRGATSVALTTDTSNNDAVNRFYVSLGFHIRTVLLTPEKRRMNEYVIDLQPRQLPVQHSVAKA